METAIQLHQVAKVLPPFPALPVRFPWGDAWSAPARTRLMVGLVCAPAAIRASFRFVRAILRKMIEASDAGQQI
jgi:hypothetical protein